MQENTPLHDFCEACADVGTVARDLGIEAVLIVNVTALLPFTVPVVVRVTIPRTKEERAAHNLHRFRRKLKRKKD